MPTIRDLRAASGKTIEQVAADLGVGYSTVYRLETGKTPLRQMTTRAFADYYGVPVEHITQPERTTAA